MSNSIDPVASSAPPSDVARGTRAASTVIVVRDRGGDIEVLLLKRSDQSPFGPGAFVFPGGTLDDDDNDAIFRNGIADVVLASVDRSLGVAHGGLSWMIAAVRECLEETGLLIGVRRAAAGRGKVITTEFRQRLRDDLDRGDSAFSQIFGAAALSLAVGDLTYVSHWITPETAPRRFDTRFFVGTAPDDQEVVVDGHEIVDHRWIAAGDALSLAMEGSLSLMRPTMKSLERVASSGTVADLLAEIAANGPDQRGILSV